MTHGPILIVDDDVDIREVLAEALEDHGFDVVTAADGLEALTLLRSMAAPPSVILLDLMMPVMNGYEFLEERRKDAVLASIPVAIITAGHGVDRDRLQNIASIIPKPLNLPKLVGVLHDMRSSAET
jgi:two-component system response regulator CpxR